MGDTTRQEILAKAIEHASEEEKRELERPAARLLREVALIDQYLRSRAAGVAGHPVREGDPVQSLGQPAEETREFAPDDRGVDEVRLMSAKLADAVPTEAGAPMPPVASTQTGRGSKLTTPKVRKKVVLSIARGVPVRGASGVR
jgi:hypothetical protein